jgi:putative flippase GtrA
MALHIQVIRYAVVGIASNLTFYRLYLAITAFGVGPKSSMTGLHLLGMQQTFIFSKRWTFFHDAAHQGPFTRYLLAYTFGYLLNFFCTASSYRLGTLAAPSCAGHDDIYLGRHVVFAPKILGFC